MAGLKNANHRDHLINLKHSKGEIILEVNKDKGVTQLVALSVIEMNK